MTKSHSIVVGISFSTCLITYCTLSIPQGVLVRVCDFCKECCSNESRKPLLPAKGMDYQQFGKEQVMLSYLTFAKFCVHQYEITDVNGVRIELMRL